MASVPIYSPAQYAPQQPANYGNGGGSGWQWGTASAMPNQMQAAARGEPNYGAPPPVPNVWRGS
jgi:hypothetical protein